MDGATDFSGVAMSVRDTVNLLLESRNIDIDRLRNHHLVGDVKVFTVKCDYPTVIVGGSMKGRNSVVANQSQHGWISSVGTTLHQHDDAKDEDIQKCRHGFGQRHG